MRSIAAGAASVDQAMERDLHAHGPRAQRLRGAGDLVRRLALHAERNEQRRDQRRGRAPVEHRVDRGSGLDAGQVAALHGALDRFAQHQALTSRKLRSSVCPSGVRMDSGWNCTPKTGSVRWRSAMTMPSRVRALTRRSRGSPRSATTRE